MIARAHIIFFSIGLTATQDVFSSFVSNSSNPIYYNIEVAPNTQKNASDWPPGLCDHILIPYTLGGRNGKIP